jgi:S-adenosylmethionine-diacylgycerolhomoserine-N-methlytransferase
MSLAADARMLWHLVRGASRAGSHAQRLQRFYGPQAQGYDAFRERLLHGRRELIERLPAGAGARVTELGGGTGRNLEFFGERLAGFAALELVDLCPALLQVARERIDRLEPGRARNVRLLEADATDYRPGQPADCVYFSYALTMIPDWQRAVENAIAMLPSGGALGVVDFHLPRSAALSGRLWRAWFAHDGVWLSDAHLPFLIGRLDPVYRDERRASVPYLPGLRVPYYLFIGRKR